MKLFEKDTSAKLSLISLICGIVVAYPNLVCLPWDLTFLDESKHLSHLLFSGFRVLYFMMLFWVLLYDNLRRMKTTRFKQRFTRTFLIAIPVYAVYILISYLLRDKSDHMSTITSQFLIIAIVSAFAGHISMLYVKQRKNEQEIEQLKIENLQSRCNALINQINPHFFFNSLNGISSLIRKKNSENTLAYVNTLSDVFRYILQSDKKGLVTLEEELDFVESFSYMMEVRYANKLIFDVEVDKAKQHLKIPVLSLLPLIDNVIMHNRIDSEHIMTVTIRLNEKDELVIANPVYPKLAEATTNGSGIKNLENRFALMTSEDIRIENDGIMFRVYLPLK
ncbi:histidine kinase [Parabacteroides sp. OttesenSCG-928-G07]|nr:histidine kinase [Parabacteroides sp. OttesenSCG-928-G21]MDL2278178.1 histidine kinase [Parabacteroides sp. OttesenSCG-928-G07]